MNHYQKLQQRFIVVVIPAQAGIHLVSCRHNTLCGSTGIFTLALLAIIVIACTCGCAPTASDDPLQAQVAGAPPEQAPLPTEKIAAVDDLPVPANMKIRKSLSRSYEGAGSRMIDYTYSGRVDIRRVHRFYRDQMPLHRWQMLTDNYIRGVYTLIFQKNKELCTVIISKDNIFWTKVQMIIQQPRKDR